MKRKTKLCKENLNAGELELQNLHSEPYHLCTLQERNYTIFHVLRKDDTSWSISMDWDIVEIAYLSPGFGLQTNEIDFVGGNMFIYFETFLELVEWLDSNERYVSGKGVTLQ